MLVIFVTLVVALACVMMSTARAEQPLYTQSLFIEDMTWMEVAAALKAGKQTALIYTGSTEQNGLQLVLGKHNFLARHLATMIARELGDALIYPVLPFAPTGDPALRSGHMRFPGSISLHQEVYAAVVQDVALSAVAAGFRNIFLMGDHGEGQDKLAAVAKTLDTGTRPYGIRVHYIAAVYLPEIGAHGGREDTSMLMAIDNAGQWVRKDQFDLAMAASGVGADLKDASIAEGQRLIDARVKAAVHQIRDLQATAANGQGK